MLRSCLNGKKKNIFFQEDFAIDVGYSADTLTARGPKAEEIKTSIQEDFVRADVFFQSLNVRSIMQSPKYSVIRKNKSEGLIINYYS